MPVANEATDIFVGSCRYVELEDDISTLRREVDGLVASRQSKTPGVEVPSEPTPLRDVGGRAWSSDGVDRSENNQHLHVAESVGDTTREYDLNLCQLNAPITAIHAMTPSFTTTVSPCK